MKLQIAFSAAAAAVVFAMPIAAAGADTPADSPQRIEKLFYGSCYLCHGTGWQGAPMAFRAEEWQPRLAKGMPQTLANAIAGLGSMPPRGACRDCKDEDLQKLIEFMSKE